MIRTALASVFALWPLAVAAQTCPLALVLAQDVSSSVDENEYILQRDGLAAALQSEDVKAAILGNGGIALAVYEWSGRRQSVVVLDWVMLRSTADIMAASDHLRTAKRSNHRFPTALGYALGFGAGLMAKAPPCNRKVIDLSGDGITNDGFWPALAYKHFPFDGITVNALAVLGADPDVVDHFTYEVLRGPGAFLETSAGYEGYERAMTRKLYREIESRVVGDAGFALD
ncbi:DUF1194 domain-containing protein [Pelagimonas varians]|uniref:von Willebrand factor type A domain protein n=1 Tax=Pelagimonas varians TaxID=696760 RepID=A0A238JZE8_9RHOB|nr:DUF1194 domain-containing protein [Pelagimonas varians]PYG33069.1 uncharacterized protein DUF1194 [Pelagimonas varians]SMX35587.1 hypothetical protein PEV8663_00525 [Pelagimonas varians]